MSLFCAGGRWFPIRRLSQLRRGIDLRSTISRGSESTSTCRPILAVRADILEMATLSEFAGLPSQRPARCLGGPARQRLAGGSQRGVYPVRRYAVLAPVAHYFEPKRLDHRGSGAPQPGAGCPDPEHTYSADPRACGAGPLPCRTNTRSDPSPPFGTRVDTLRVHTGHLGRKLVGSFIGLSGWPCAALP